MRIVFFGTPAFAVPSLEALLEVGEQVVAVVTQPVDRMLGRPGLIGLAMVAGLAAAMLGRKLRGGATA